MNFVLPLGTTGLVKADLGLRLYLAAVRQSSAEAAITVTEVGSSGDYSVGGLPDGAATSRYALTYEYPAGVGGSFYWPTQTGAPAQLVIPVRETGLVAADLGLALYQDGVARPDALAAAELESGGGDYAVSGWPLSETGSWVLRWSRAGISFSCGWTAQLATLPGVFPAATATATDRSARALALRLIRTKGRTLILRRSARQEVKTGATAGTVASSPLSTSALLVNGTAALGATAISLDAAAATGLLLAGDFLAIAGHSQVYTVTGGPYAASGNALGPVTFTPALSAEAANNTAVAVTFSGTDSTIKGAVSAVSKALLAAGLAQVGDVQILVAQKALDDASLTIVQGHEIFLGDSTSAPRYTVLRVEPIPSGEQDAAVTVFGRLRG